MAKVEIEDTELAEIRKAAGLATRQAAQIEALQVKVSEAATSATRLAELEGRLASITAEKLDATFATAGVTNPKIRKLFELEHAEVAATEGGEKDLGKWLGSLQAMKAEERPAHLAPFITAPVAGTGIVATGTQGPGRLPNVNKGVQTTESAPPAVTPEAVNKMTDAEFKTAFPILQAQFPELKGFVLPTGATTPAA